MDTFDCYRVTQAFNSSQPFSTQSASLDLTADLSTYDLQPMHRRPAPPERGRADQMLRPAACQ